MDIENIYKVLDEITGHQGRVKKNESMKEHTTFKIGGPADIFVQPASSGEIAEIVKFLREKNVPIMVNGNGSNMLVLDGGIRGVVINLGKNISDIRVDGTKVYAQAGALLSAIAAKAAEAGLTGMEFAAGIPGSAGGAIFMNAGAYGGEMSHIAASCEVVLPDGKLKIFDKDELELGYRKSAFAKNGGIVVSCTFELQPGNRDEILARMNELAQKRRDKQPLEMPSAGSTFKRPEGHFAGKLIEDSGCKGLGTGGARVSLKHTGFIVNEGDATAQDVLDLIKLVQMTVKAKTGVMLEPEVRIIGEPSED